MSQREIDRISVDDEYLEYIKLKLAEEHLEEELQSLISQKGEHNVQWRENLVIVAEALSMVRSELSGRRDDGLYK